MTTKDDWEFRAEYFRGQAKRLRGKVYELECEAAKMDDLALSRS
jgi:hypothetical protein